MNKFLLVAMLSLALVAHGQIVVAPVTSECATSTDGSVVGTPNPLNPPIVAAVYSGTLSAGNYYVEEAWYDAATNTTLVSPEVQLQLTGTGEIQENPPSSGLAATVVGRNIYIGTYSGGETLQGSVVGSGTFTQSTPLVAGAAVPATNTTQCLIVANDAGWPTGTGYQASLTTPAGGTMPGYPQQWQILGPGGTINLSQGVPFYNGTVTYPVPILARPYNHGPQSISGPLSMTGFNLTGIGRLGVDTGTPQYGIDVQGNGNNADINAAGSIFAGESIVALTGAINSAEGYLFDGTAPLNHTLISNGTFYVDSPGVIATSFTTTAATTDTVTVTGMTSSGHCSLQPTNAGAAGGIASVYVSAKTTNQITVTHTATATWTFDVLCVPY
jgi:hypothetical protein